MKLTLQHCPNPDISHDSRAGYWQHPIDKKTLTVEVTDLKDAQKQFLEWIKRNSLGGGNLTRSCGQVVDRCKVVAVISYNGRIWSKHYDEEGCVEIKLDAVAAPEVQNPAPAPFARMERLTVEQAEAFEDILCNYPDGIGDEVVAIHRCAVTGHYVEERRARGLHPLPFCAAIDCYDDAFTTLEEAVAWLKEHWLKLYPPAQSKRAMTIHSTEQAFTSVAIVAMKAALEKINECRRKCPGVGGDVDAMNLRAVIAANQPDQHVMAQALRCLESLAPSLEIQADHEIAALRFAVDVLS